MTRLLSLRPRLILGLSLCLLSCAGPAMLLPPAVLGAPAWGVSGYAERTLHEHDFSLGGAVVRRIERSGQRAKLAKRSIEPAATTTRTYRFELTQAGVVLSATCSERATPEPHVLGFGARERRLDCVCSEGTQPRGTLGLLDGEGSIRLPNGRGYLVTEERQSATGARQSEALGYLIRSPHGNGALERTGSGRAWPPPGLDERAAVELRCVYAALLLYRP